MTLSDRNYIMCRSKVAAATSKVESLAAVNMRQDRGRMYLCWMIDTMYFE